MIQQLKAFSSILFKVQQVTTLCNDAERSSRPRGEFVSLKTLISSANNRVIENTAQINKEKARNSFGTCEYSDNDFYLLQLTDISNYFNLFLYYAVYTFLTS